MQSARVHHHSRNMTLEMYGQRLEPGDTVEPGDVYDSSDGTWRQCGAQMHGQPLEDEVQVVIVRPLPVMTFGQQPANS